MSDNSPFKFRKEGKFTFMNKQVEDNCSYFKKNNDHNYINGKCSICQKWQRWKKWEEMNDIEKQKVNLGQYDLKYILLDFDMKGKSDEEIDLSYKNWVETKTNIYKNFIADRSPNGFHIYLPFSNLSDKDPKIQHEIRKIFVNGFKADPAKIPITGVISLPNRPHFKTMKIYPVLNITNEINDLPEDIFIEAKEKVKEKEELAKFKKKDANFNNYIEEDPFFKYVSENVIPDGTARDHVIFPNLAVALSNTGKDTNEIKNIMMPIIRRNFPGKTWAEFNGWLKKAFANTVDDYNKYQLNTWMKEHSEDKKEIYSVTASTEKKNDVMQELEKKEPEIGNKKGTFKVYWDDELDQLENREIEWVVENWIPKGDICFIAGKSASYKSTICVHMAYAVSKGGMVFNKYNTDKQRVLYLNEENSSSIMMSMVTRVKKGLRYDDVDKNIGFSMMEGIRLDKNDHVLNLIEFINHNKIEFLICDSFRRFLGFDENNATEMNAFFAKLNVIRKRCKGLTITIIHHQKKDNIKGTGDVRDSLRGSSDIVNSADSIISIGRKAGGHYVNIQHIKNRSGEEMGNKVLAVESGDDNDEAYIYETDKVADKNQAISKDQKAAEVITEWITKNKIKNFTSKEIPEIIQEEFKKNSVFLALKNMVLDEVLEKVGGARNTTYNVNQLYFEDIEKKKEEKKLELDPSKSIINPKSEEIKKSEETKTEEEQKQL